MPPENLALLAILTTSIAFGISDTLWKIPLRIFSPEICIFIRNIGTTLFLGTTAFLAKKVVLFDFDDVSYGVFISCISFFGLYFFGKSQKHSNISLIAPLLILIDFIIFLMGVFYWKESANTGKWLCFGLSLIGSFLISFQGNNYQKDNKNNEIGIRYGLLAAVFWGVSYSFFKDTTQKLGVATFGFILEATILVMSVLAMIFMKVFFKKSQEKQQQKTLENQINQPKITQQKALFFLLIISFLGTVGVYSSNLVYATLPISSLVIVGIFGKIIPILIGRIFYKEQILRQQYAGIVLQIIALAVFKFV